VIRLESTDYASSTNTFGIAYRILSAIFGRIDPQVVLTTNSVLRKSGHFVGYAILSLLVFLALKYTHHDRLKPMLQRRWGSCLRDSWQLDWAKIAVLFTLVTASFDEIHQATLASRTGTWHDVTLDTAGAVLMQLLLYGYATHLMNIQRQNFAQEREASLTR
jgi:VanZ family protein